MLKEFIKEVKENPKECLQDSIVMLLMFATCYYMLILGSIIGLQ